MIFSSFTFLLLFMPIVLLLMRILPAKGKLPFLLAASLLFYGWGNPLWLPLLVYSILLNYMGGKCLGACCAHKKVYLFFLIILNLLPLLYYKYAALFVSAFTSIAGISNNFEAPLLPAGISFFTFQGLSYLVDVYRGKVKVQKSFVAFGVYLSLFPQLVAGPIVRYEDMEQQLAEPPFITDRQMLDGLKRFTVGLSKKMLLADSMGRMCTLLHQDTSSAGLLGAWTYLIVFSFQIYFDFSGYSDMAIGLGYAMGFRWPENFRKPYRTSSLTDFWRNWHITLTTWFKEYVYIPLGGSRQGKFRRDVNLLIVWALTGLWHGAGWHFLFWGLYFGVLLIVEKRILRKEWYLHIPVFIRRVATYIFVLIGWGIFTGCDIEFFRAALGLHGFISSSVLLQLSSFLPTLLLCGIAAFAPRIRILKYKVVLPLMFILCLCVLAAQSYTPFVYFQF